MGLLDMSIELLRAILETSVVLNGLDNAMMMRLVCKTFDIEIIRAICATNALDAPDYHHRYFGQRLYSEYFLARTLADHNRTHHLSEVIFDTVDYILKETSQDRTQRVEYVRSLCVAMVQGYYPSEVMKILNPAWCSSDSDSPITRIECSLEESTLAAAAYLGITPLFKRLIEDGVQNTKTYFGRPLDWSARRGDLELMRLLLEKGSKMVDVEELHNAARNGHREVVQLLLDPKYGNAISSSNCQSAIWAAAAGGHQDVILFLMQRNEIKLVGNIQDRILQSASLHGQEEIARTALDNGANPNVMRHPISPWITPLDAAAKNGHKATVQLLLVRGATQRPRRRPNPLIHAIRGGWLDIAQILIDDGAEVNPIKSQKEPYPKIPWRIAVIHGQADMLRLLIKNGANVNADQATAKEGYSHARLHGYTTIMRILVESGIEAGSDDKI